MGLTYQSTRGGEAGMSASTAILQGLAKDGGLFMPAKMPKLDVPMGRLSAMTYQETAHEVMKLFLTDYTQEELKSCIARAHGSKLDTEEIVPLAKVEGAYLLELYHGCTITSKDMAPSILPRLMTTATKKNQVDKETVILIATSGDTGRTAVAGFADIPGTRIIVFYPKDGVNKVQELQMRTQKGENTSIVAIHGNFNDVQTGVKGLFGDKELEAQLATKGFQLSSANSINIGRLVPRIVYYIYAYAKLLANEEIEQGEEINIVVPTGNFGNILVAYFAKRMGLPIKNPVCASNDNKVLYDFLATGTYDRKGEFILTNSPSIDILISNNLERPICLSTGCDGAANEALMQELSAKGSYAVTRDMREFMFDFKGGYATQEESAAVIKKMLDHTGYLIDTHMGVAAAVYGQYRAESGNHTKTVIASTASPYKFSNNVMEAITGPDSVRGRDEFEVMGTLGSLSKVVVPRTVEEIRNASIRHDTECGVDKMKTTVKDILECV